MAFSRNRRLGAGKLGGKRGPREIRKSSQCSKNLDATAAIY
jgi:hypothetical protein